MLTKDDKKFITETVGESIVKNNEVLIKEVMELFNVTNKRIDESDKKIDKIIEKLDEHNNFLNDHELRIGKLEDKVFHIST